MSTLTLGKKIILSIEYLFLKTPTYLARVKILQQQSECAAGDLSVAKRHHGAVPPLALEHGAEVGGARAQQEPVAELQTKVREDFTIFPY